MTQILGRSKGTRYKQDKSFKIPEEPRQELYLETHLSISSNQTSFPRKIVQSKSLPTKLFLARKWRSV